jgi:RNA polymerase sigma-70 factor (ECF subfamily)
MTGNREDAEDLCQETFLRALKTSGLYDRTRSLLTWLLKIAANLTRDHRRRKGIYAAKLQELQHARREIATESPEAPEATVARGELMNALGEEVAALEERQGIVFLLFYRDGMKIAEIAGVLGLPEGTVKSHLHRARRRIRDRLKGKGWL